MRARRSAPISRGARTARGRTAGRLALALLALGGIVLLGRSAGVRPAAAQQVDPGCALPSVTVSASPSTVVAGGSVTFNFSAVAGAGCVMPPLPSMLIGFGDGTSPLPLNGPSGTISHTYNAPGSFSVLVTARSGEQTGEARTTVTVLASGGQTVLNLTAVPQTVQAGQTVDFTGQVLSSARGAITTGATIAFGDGIVVTPQTTGAGFIAQHSYVQPGNYVATLVVTNSTGASAQTTTTVTVTASPVQPVVALRAAPLSAVTGQNVNFTGQVVSDTPGAVTTSATIFFGDGQSATPLTTGAGFIAQHAYARPGVYVATLAVTDSAGRTGRATIKINVSSSGVTWP